MADITAEHEADDAQAAQPAPPADQMPQAPDLNETEQAFEDETAERFTHVREKLRELAKREPDMAGAFELPSGTLVEATLNTVVEVLVERGVLSEKEFMLRRRRHMTVIAEAFLASAEAFMEAQSNLVGPDGERLVKQPPKPVNRKARRHPPKPGKVPRR